VNEKTQTQTVAGPRSVQRDASPQSRIEREKEIAALKGEEEKLFTARGYGGYIDTDRLNALREKWAALQAGPALEPASNP